MKSEDISDVNLVITGNSKGDHAGKKDDHIHVKMSSKTKRRLQKQAERLKLNVSSFIRSIADGENVITSKNVITSLKNSLIEMNKLMLKNRENLSFEDIDKNILREGLKHC